MKFDVIFSTKEDRFESEVDGDLDSVKMYIKLKAGDDFTWGAVSRTNDLSPGDVDRWFIQKNRTTGALHMEPFSFYKVDPLININAMRAAFEHYPQMQSLSKMLGGGIL